MASERAGRGREGCQSASFGVVGSVVGGTVAERLRCPWPCSPSSSVCSRPSVPALERFPYGSARECVNEAVWLLFLVASGGAWMFVWVRGC